MRGNFVIVSILLFSALNSLANGHPAKKYQPAFFILPDTTVKAGSDDSTSDEDVKHRKFEIGLEGANDQSYHGVRNIKPIPYLEPSFTYTAKSGFYIGINDQYIISTQNIPKSRAGFDVFSANPGWDIDLGENTTLNFNMTLYSYKKRTPNLLKSGLFLTPETYLDQYIIGELEGKLTIDYDIYRATTGGQPKTPNDFVITPDLQYTFDWDFGKNDQNSFSVTPEANVEFGTRNYITIFQNNVIGDTATGNKTKYTVNSSSSFGALDCNFILSLELTLGKFSIEPDINYTIPLYSQVTFNQTSLISTKPYFYGSLTLTYTIKSKK